MKKQFEFGVIGARQGMKRMDFVIRSMIRLVETLAKYKINISTEEIAQRDIAEVLTKESISFEREMKLSDEDRIDFMVLDCIGVEVKTKGSRMDIYRQLERYSKHDSVAGIILVTSKKFGNITNIGPKPICTLELGKAWL